MLTIFCEKEIGCMLENDLLRGERENHFRCFSVLLDKAYTLLDRCIVVLAKGAGFCCWSQTNENTKDECEEEIGW